MNWLKWLGVPSKSGRQKRKARPTTAGVPVPRLLRNRPNSKIPRFSSPASEPDNAAATPHSADGARLNLAFTPAQPVSDLRRFAGRTELLERLIRAIEHQRMHVVVYGDRGIGKTSLLHILTLLAREARYVVRYTSCSEDSEFEDVFRSAAADIPVRFHSEYDPTSPEAEKGRSLADTFGERALTPASLSEAFAKVAGTRILLILDEFDRAKSPAFRKGVAELIKNLSDRSARVQIVIGGVAANLAELVEHIPSIRRNVLGLPVGPMSEAELLQIIANAQATGQILFEADSGRGLLGIGNGSPYLVNLIGLQAGALAIARHSKSVSLADVRAATKEVEGEFRNRLSPAALKQLSALEQALPSEMLAAAGRHAQHHFGELLPNQTEAFAGALGKSHEDDWWSDTGEFRFCEDSIPIILWLTHANEMADEPAKSAPPSFAPSSKG